MGTLVNTAQRAARGIQARILGSVVTYVRGSDFTLQLTGIVQCRTEWKGMGQGGLVVISESVDWLIPALSLVDADELVTEPLQGDQIIVGTDTLECVYDVQPFGPDQLLWRWHDRVNRTARRVFTKLLSEESL